MEKRLNESLQKQREQQTVTDESERKKKPLKSGAKAAGLKSVFVLSEGKELLTSFGRGNEAVPEKRVTGGTIANARTDNKEAFSAALQNKRFEVFGRTAGSSDDPLAVSRAPGQDLIGAKTALEERYFGRAFADNIHMQVIYAIQDINKILAVHANNIVYTLNNLDREADPETDDFIGSGYLTLKNTFETYCDPAALNEREREKVTVSKQHFDAFMQNPRLAYYGNAFFRKLSKAERLARGREIFDKESPERRQEILGSRGKNKSVDDEIRALAPEWVKREERDVYSELVLMSELRQSCFHGQQKNSARIFRLDNDLGPGVDGARELLDRLYAEKINDLRSFDKTSASSNFRLLFNAYHADNEKKKELAQEFYRFSVLKVSKNTGFSIRTLREKIIEDHAAQYRDKIYDSMRKKLFSTFDFFLWRFYEEREDEAEELRACLRAARSDEEKEQIYAEAAASCWPSVKPFVESVAATLCDVVKGRTKLNKLKLSADESTLVRNAIDGVRISPRASYFTKLIYLMTLFLDGKEINDLLTTLIHAFENIDSFLSVLGSERLERTFDANYRIFADSGVIAQELRAVNSFARMTTEPFNSKLVMFEDAAQLFGMSGGLVEHAEELREYLDNKMLDKTKLRLLPDGKVDTGFRNFIISNVTESRRFRYLVRYCEPRAVRDYMSCRPLIRLTLRDMPDTILRRYYEQSVGAATVDRERILDTLADKLLSLRFTDFENVNQRANAERNREKQKMMGIISLYLNVAYQIVKNLVYVNARYTMAYHCAERDTELLLNAAGEGNLLRRDRSWPARLHLPRRALARRRDRVEVMERDVARGPEAYNRDEWLGLVRTLRREKRVCDNLHNNYAYLCGADAEPGDASLSLLFVYRNKAAHLSVLNKGGRLSGDLKEAKSWFYVYHFLMQRVLEEEFRNTQALPERLRELLMMAERYRGCSKDLIKVLNLTFAYNLPRYKNLSIDGRFDKNHPDPSDE